MSTSLPAETVEKLAANIGEVVYIDVAKWHLYLNDAKLHTLVAQRLSPLFDEASITEASVNQILADIPVPVGARRQQIPLLDLIPNTCISDLVRVLEDFRETL
ncbi:MAG: DUF3181 family protein [Cyanobacteria bacterium J06638_28]